MTETRKPRKLKGHKTEAVIKITKARQRTRVANKDVPKGKKRAVSVERREVKKREKQKWQADQKARHTGTLTELKPIAKEINTRLEKAAGLDGKADDHRLAAALQLEKARQVCKAAKIGFPGWVKANVDKSYEEVKKLVAVAAKPEPAKALADMRAGAATRNRQLRKRQKVSRDASASVAVDPVTATSALDILSDEAALEIISAKAASVGMRIVSEDEVKPPMGPPVQSTLKGLQIAFVVLKPSDKLMFVKWASDMIGVVVSGDFQEAEDAGGKRPDFLDREKQMKSSDAGASA